MQFTFDSVVEAITIATSYDQNQNQEQKQGALDYLQQWTHSEDGSIVALQILSNENLSQPYKIYAASLIKTQIPFVWGKLSKEDKLNLKQQFFGFFESTQSENGDLLLEMIISILTSIALYEFPQDWPELQNIVFLDISQIENLLIKSHYAHFIAQFISEVDKSPNISPARNQFLRNLFLDNCDALYVDITTCFDDEHLITDGLKIFNAFLQWATFEQVNNSVELFRILCFNFIINKNTRREALECLTTVFSTRLDSTTFVTISPLIIFALCSPNSILDNQQHATSDPDVLNFILRVLTRFMPHLLTVFDPSNESNRTQAIRSAMQENQLGPDELRRSLIYVLGVVVSIRVNEYLTEEYWTFWITIFHNMLSEKKKGPEASKPICAFMLDLLPEIREAIYHCVPLDHLDDTEQQRNNSNDSSAPYVPQQSVFCTNRSRSAWSLIALIDPDGTLAFIQSQPASIAQCYAIGNLEFCNQEQFDVSRLSQELNELYTMTDSKNPDEDFFVALLFCFSHTLTFDTGGQSFMSFVDFATKCVIEENPPISTAATNALLYATRRVKSGFLSDNYVLSICDNAETYLMKLEHDDAVRMYRIASSLACTMSTDEQITELYAKLAEPLNQAIEAEFQPEKIFDCIREASNQAGSKSRIFMSFIWEKLFIITDKVIHTNPPSIILESCLDAVSTGIRNEEFNEVNINRILAWLYEKTQSNLEIHHQIDDSFFKFIGYVRSKFSELNIRLPDIITSFVEPVAPIGLASLSSIMWMLSEFTFQLFDFDWFVPLAIESIKSPDKMDNINGLHCTRLLVSRTNQDTFLEAIKNGILPSILTVTFASLTDTMHKESIQSLIEFIKLIMIQGSKFNMIDSVEFGQMFLNSIAVNVQEPQPNMFHDFVATLLKNINRPFNFSKTVSEFLILIRTISPNDVNAFKVRQVDTSLTGRGRIIKIEPDGETQEISSSDQKHFRIIRKPTGF